MSDVLILFTAIIIVIGIFWIFYKAFTTFYKNNDSTMMTGKLPLIDDKLIKLKDWHSYLMIKFRLIKDTPKMYSLLIRFNFNDLPTFYKLLKQEEQLQQEISDINKLNKVSLFDLIVQELDKSTDSVDPLVSETIPDRAINSVADQTSSIFGFGTGDLSGDGGSAGTISQSKANQIYRLLDMIQLDFKLQKLIQITYNDRQLFLKIPLTYITVVFMPRKNFTIGL